MSRCKEYFLAAISLDIQRGAEVKPKARNVAKCGAVKSYPSLAVVIPHVCCCCCSSTNRNEVKPEREKEKEQEPSTETE